MAPGLSAFPRGRRQVIALEHAVSSYVWECYKSLGIRIDHEASSRPPSGLVVEDPRLPEPLRGNRVAQPFEQALGTRLTPLDRREPGGPSPAFLTRSRLRTRI